MYKSWSKFPLIKKNLTFMIYEGDAIQGNISVFIVGVSREASYFNFGFSGKYKTDAIGWEVGLPSLWGGASWVRTFIYCLLLRIQVYSIIIKQPMDISENQLK
jgi:hypothetical protein